jgi:ADP-heptose:LPS heptosyltransferase
MIRFIFGTLLGLLHAIDVFMLKLLKPILLRNTTADNDSILVVHLSAALGDEIWIMGFIKMLQDNLPGRKISLVAGPKFEKFISSNTENVDLYCFPFVGDKTPRLLIRIFQIVVFARTVGRKFSMTITPRFLDDQYAAFICYALSAGDVIGFDQNSSGGRQKYCLGINRLLSRRTMPLSDSAPFLDNIYQLVKLVAPHPTPLKSPWLNNNNNIKNTNISFAKKRVALSVTSGHSVLKKWPNEYFFDFMHTLNSEMEGKVHFILIGDKADLADSKALENPDISFESQVAKLTLNEVLDLLRSVDLYVGADTGLLHMANAAGTPCIGIYGSSCHHQFGPYLKDNSMVLSGNFPCGPCSTGHKIDRCKRCIFDDVRCMKFISGARVAALAKSSFLTGG